MGGSFNPAHEGHAMVAATALKRLRLDQLWWVVTPGNPLKAAGDLKSQADRIARCAALADHPRMFVTGFETDLLAGASGRSHFTADTLAFLTKRHPAVHFVWVMGADNLATFHRWERWQAITETMAIAVVDRPGWHLRALSSPAAHRLRDSRVPERSAARLPFAKPPAWVFLSTRLNAASSTELRAQAHSVAKNTF